MRHVVLRIGAVEDDDEGHWSGTRDHPGSGRRSLPHFATTRPLLGFLALGGLAVLAPTATAQPGPTPAGLVVLSHSAVFRPATGQVTFTVTFNRAPDFESVDALGRQADSFQYFI